MAHRTTTPSQRNRVTEVLEEEQPARADIELLNDGSVLLTLWRDGELRYHPYLMRRLGRRGDTVREAKRTATGWSEFTGPANYAILPREGSDSDTRAWMEGS